MTRLSIKSRNCASDPLKATASLPPQVLFLKDTQLSLFSCLAAVQAFRSIEVSRKAICHHSVPRIHPVIRWLECARLLTGFNDNPQIMYAFPPPDNAEMYGDKHKFSSCESAVSHYGWYCLCMLSTVHFVAFAFHRFDLGDAFPFQVFQVIASTS